MCDSNKKTPSNEAISDKNEKINNKSSKSQETSNIEKNVYSIVMSFIENLKKSVKKFYTELKNSSTSNQLLHLITTAEILINDFYGGIIKRVKNFVEIDLQKLKTMSKEETEKTKKILLQYSDRLQKISNEKIKKILDLKEQLRTKIVKAEELHLITKFFETKMTEVKILTDEIYNSLAKGETITFVKDLQKSVETRSNTLKASLNLLLGSAKEKIPKIQSSIKSIDTHDLLAKMPNLSETLKSLSTSFSKILVQKKTGCVNGQGTSEAVGKKSMSTMGHGEEAGGESLKGLARYFNSQTNYGRANVSKATYLSVALIGLYFYLKPSKKAAAK